MHAVRHYKTIYDSYSLLLLATSCHILQIGAIGPDGQQFSCEVQPKEGITEGASNVNGYYINTNGQLKNTRRTVVPESVLPIGQALNQLLQFLRGYENPIMCAHNGRKFDDVVLKTALENTNLVAQFVNIVHGFLDTMHLFKDAFPLRCRLLQTTIFS